MENASKALLMAGGVFLTILVVSLLMYAMNIYSDYQQNQIRLAEIEDTAKFNQQFTNYERDDVLGYEVLSLANKVMDYNNRESDAVDENGKTVNDKLYKKIKLTIRMWGNGTGPKEDGTEVKKADIENDFTAQMKVPKISDAGNVDIYGKDLKLIPEKMEQSGVKEEIKTKFYKVVGDIEKKEDFGGNAIAVQNIVKEKGTIYEGKIINYNTPTSTTPIDKTWYDEQYLLSRYKTLTGKKMNNVKDIRKSNLMEDIAKYYEYMQFKKAIFKCTGIIYDDGASGTGRVIEMNFAYTGKIK